ncbi:MAG TPA: hypothetical protein VM164_04820 [Burkholderiales bacterium]|nr:hypothetical protein [Burkholderiales bacterium]
MSQNDRSTLQYIPVTAPERTTLGLPFRVEKAAQTKANLSVWEGEGGATEAPVPVAAAPVIEDEQIPEEAETTDVIDTIAYIEMNRQVMAKEAGADAARNEALRKLNEALADEQQLAQGSGANAMHTANIEALSAAVRRLKSSPQAHRSGSRGQKSDVLRVPTVRQNAPRNPANRPSVRRTGGGRDGGRDGNR